LRKAGNHDPPEGKRLGERGQSAGEDTGAIKALGLQHVLMLPVAESRLLYQPSGTTRTKPHHPMSRGRSIAIAGASGPEGASLSSHPETGLMERGTLYAAAACGPRVPLRLVVGLAWLRSAQAGRMPIDSAYTYTEPLLSAGEIPLLAYHGDEDLPMLERMDRTAAETPFPCRRRHGLRLQAMKGEHL